MKKSNFSIKYFPSQKLSGQGFEIDISDEFVEFARKQKLNKERYENLAREAYVFFGFEKSLEFYVDRQICNWEGDSGLLHHVIVPGNAAGICLEEGLAGLSYTPNNIDSPNQALVLFRVMFHYLNDIELRIPNEK